MVVVALDGGGVGIGAGAHGTTNGRQKAAVDVSSVTNSTSAKRAARWRRAARHRERRSFRLMKAAPRRPPPAPRRTNTGKWTSCGVLCSRSALVWLRNEPKAISPSLEIWPNWLPGSVESRTLSISVEQSAQKKVRHVSGCDQYVAASSSAKSTPPIGAPKAAATPAAAPAETKSRLSWSLRKRLSHIVRSRHVFDEPCERPAATIAPVWIIGPSLPSTSPLATEHSTPTVFASSVRVRSSPGTRQPWRYDLTSGMPEPPAIGATSTTSAAATDASADVYRQYTANIGQKLGSSSEPRDRKTTYHFSSTSFFAPMSMPYAKHPVTQPTAEVTSHRCAIAARRTCSKADGCRCSSASKSDDASMS